MSTHPAHTYLRLAEGPDDRLVSERARTRRALILLVALVLLVGGMLLAAGVGSGIGVDKAVAASGPGKDGQDDDNSGPGGDDDDDDDSDGVSTQGTTGTDDSRGT